MLTPQSADEGALLPRLPRVSCLRETSGPARCDFRPARALQAHDEVARAKATLSSGSSSDRSQIAPLDGHNTGSIETDRIGPAGQRRPVLMSCLPLRMRPSQPSPAGRYPQAAI